MTAAPGFWTEERVARMRELLALGFGPSAIADDLGTYRERVASMLGRWRNRWPGTWLVPRPPWIAERVARALELADAGWQYKAIGAELGTTKNAIAGIIHRHRPPAVPLLAQLEARLNWPQVQQTGCRWIDGDPAEPGWRYCGAVCVEGSSWCAEHGKRLVVRSQTPQPAAPLRLVAA